MAVRDVSFLAISKYNKLEPYQSKVVLKIDPKDLQFEPYSSTTRIDIPSKKIHMLVTRDEVNTRTLELFKLTCH